MQPLRIAFLACNKNPALFHNDASYRYRCENLALMLRDLGHEVTLSHHRNFKPETRYDIIVFHRPSDSWHFRRALTRCRNTGAQLIADVDDLIIHPQWAVYSPGVLNGLLSLKKTEEQYRKNQAALACFSKFTTSTPPLAEKLELVFSGAVRVIPNAPHQLWKTIAPITLAEQLPLLTYFPGTRSHQRDFASIEAPLKVFLDEYPHFKLAITGVMDAPTGIRPEQLSRQGKQPFEHYAALVSTSWINLSPLEPTPFNQCKSALKTIEAAFWNKPTVSSPTSDAMRYEHRGALIAEGQNDWYTQLSRLADPEFYDQYTTSLAKKASDQALPQDLTTTFLSFGLPK